MSGHAPAPLSEPEIVALLHFLAHVVPPEPEILADVLAHDVPLNNALKPHQRVALQRLYPLLNGLWRGVLLADDMGLGKTFTALALVFRYCCPPPPLPADDAAPAPQHTRALIILPNAQLVRQWQDEVAQHLGPRMLVDDVLEVPTATEKVEYLNATGGPLIIFTTVDVLSLAAAALGGLQSVSLLVLDEAHEFRSAPQLRAALASMLAALGTVQGAGQAGQAGGPARLLLTGTPVQNSIEELFNVVAIAAPGLLGDTVQDCLALSLQELHARLHSITVRRGIAVIQNDLPERTCRIIYVESGTAPEAVSAQGQAFPVGGAPIPAAAAEAAAEAAGAAEGAPAPAAAASSWYNMFLGTIGFHGSAASVAVSTAVATTDYLTQDAASAAAGAGPQQTPPAIALMNTVARVCAGVFLRGSEIPTSAAALPPKLAMAHALTTAALEKNHIVIVVSFFHQPLDILASLLPPGSFVHFTGSTAQTERERIMKIFSGGAQRTDDDPRVLYLSKKSGAAGLQLTAATHMILLDPAFNPFSDAQAMARIYRLGQLHAVFIYRLAIRDSIEEQVIINGRTKQMLECLLDPEAVAADLVVHPVDKPTVSAWCRPQINPDTRVAVAFQDDPVLVSAMLNVSASLRVWVCAE